MKFRDWNGFNKIVWAIGTIYFNETITGHGHLCRYKTSLIAQKMYKIWADSSVHLTGLVSKQEGKMEETTEATPTRERCWSRYCLISILVHYSLGDQYDWLKRWNGHDNIGWISAVPPTRPGSPSTGNVTSSNQDMAPSTVVTNGQSLSPPPGFSSLPSMSTLSGVNLPSMYLHGNLNMDWPQAFPPGITGGTNNTGGMVPYFTMSKYGDGRKNLPNGNGGCDVILKRKTEHTNFQWNIWKSLKCPASYFQQILVTRIWPTWVSVTLQFQLEMTSGVPALLNCDSRPKNIRLACNIAWDRIHKTFLLITCHLQLSANRWSTLMDRPTLEWSPQRTCTPVNG